MINYSALLPPAWKELYLPFWFQEDFVGLDVASAVLGDAQGSGQILFKSDKSVLAGRPFVDGIFNFMNCDVNWSCDEGEWINCPQAIAIVTGPASNLLKAERLALNLLARCSTIATNARALAEESAAVKLAGTRKTTPGFRLVEKYALLVGGVDTHRFNCTDCVMLKDNHIDLLKEQGIDLKDAISLVKQAASFTAKVEVECRSIADAQISIQSGADIVMLDNFIPSADEISGLKGLNPRVIIELSGGINKQNVHFYPNDPSIILSLGEFTHSPGKLLDFSFKIIK